MTDATDKALEGIQLKSALAQFTGTENYYRHGLMRKMVMTDGVYYLAEKAGAHWLTDIIASHQITAKVKLEEFQFWHLKNFPVNGMDVKTFGEETGIVLSASKSKAPGAVVWMTDGNDDHAIIHQVIEYSSFPMDEVKLYLIKGENWTLMLPSEY